MNRTLGTRPGILIGTLIAMLLLTMACSADTDAPPPTVENNNTTETMTDTAALDAPAQEDAPVTVIESTGEGLLAARTPVTDAVDLPALAEYESAVAATMAQNPPVLLLADDYLDDNQRLAQQIVMQEPSFLRFVYNGPQQTPLLNEIMTVRSTLPGDWGSLGTEGCGEDECYRVEMYNYAINLTTVALVNIAQQTIVALSNQVGLQPDIPPHLTEIATEIALHAPEVIEALGFEPESDDLTMPNIKTALNDTVCERSQHLCVAPTFVVGNQALWAIVDLTDRALVGIRWTDLGASNASRPAVTEESLQDQVVSEFFCERSTELSRNGWEMSYMITSSDGLLITDVRFDGQPVMRSAKLVDWHVSYSGTDGFGYNDATGCPIFSSAAVVAYNGPQVQEIIQNGERTGFALVQDFLGDGWPQACHYRYQQRYEFYADGRFRIGGSNLGRGCGTNGIYRPVLRVDIAADGDGSADSFAEWSGSDWSIWESEQWQLQDAETAYTDEGYQYRITGADGSGYYIEPGQGQFDDGGRGDNAYVYVTKRHADQDEGESDLVTLGSCCNDDHQQGPEQFMEPAEAITESDLVLWYVAQMPNDDTPGQEYCWADTFVENGLLINRSYPCAFGPMFTPIVSASE